MKTKIIKILGIVTLSACLAACGAREAAPKTDLPETSASSVAEKSPTEEVSVSEEKSGSDASLDDAVMPKIVETLTYDTLQVSYDANRVTYSDDDTAYARLRYAGNGNTSVSISVMSVYESKDDYLDSISTGAGVVPSSVVKQSAVIGDDLTCTQLDYLKEIAGMTAFRTYLIPASDEIIALTVQASCDGTETYDFGSDEILRDILESARIVPLSF